MEFTIDLGSFNIEAADEDEAYAKARQMIDRDPSWAVIDLASPC